MSRKKILVAMSGGVDSSAAAALLLEAGHEVAGATMRTWASEECAARGSRSCCGLAGAEDARRVADRLGIRHWVFNFEKEFKEKVMDPFAAEYLRGRTPNPCISCNEHVKFRLFWDRARQLGFEDMASGHYARVGRDPGRGVSWIEEGRDPRKDQSYVLFPLDQELLGHLHLPAGELTKTEIRNFAKVKGLEVWDKEESQEICFVPDDDYGLFLKRRYVGEESAPGVIRMKDGTVLGPHDGYYHYTRGQRRGLGVAWRERLYVLGTDPERNEVVVGTKQEIFAKQCSVRGVHWFLEPDFSRGPVQACVKIRSQHTKAPAALEPAQTPGELRVSFHDAQDAITPGQAAVFYDGPRVLGGGWIEEVFG
ncbi:MAG: tRNA 2-thiouridine(34) synthase MnmA [Candidatus Omnitrophota bacterium]